MIRIISSDHGAQSKRSVNPYWLVLVPVVVVEMLVVEEKK